MIKKLFLFFFLISTTVSANDKAIKWNDSGFNTTDKYIQSFRKGTKDVNINGKIKKYNVSFFSTFPNVKKNQKNWECREWTVDELYFNDTYLQKNYSLNDCLPCLNKGSGYLCSYPYISLVFTSSFNDKISNKEDKRILELLEDGTNKIELWINLGSREKIQIIRKKVINKENKTLDLYASKIMKYNTRYRDIPSEVSKIKIAKGAESIKLMRILDRVVRKALVAIDNKTEFNIRDKDIKNLMSIEPSATITKFQTRD